AERVLAADRHERVESEGAEVLEHLLDAAFDLVRVRPRRADDRAAARQDPGDLARPERLQHSVDEPAPAVPDAEDVVAARERAARNRADDGVEARAVAAAGEDPDVHRRRL